ncbi:hypothetical protein CB1_000249014 [Camelus ferus]|nr:hypothetical protein CB1_000249014 [Camelus ferus]
MRESYCLQLGGSPQRCQVPRRFSWPTETNTESLQPWKVTKTNSSLQDRLPLQKTLVPTRSIPVRGRRSRGPPEELWKQKVQPSLCPRRELDVLSPSTLQCLDGEGLPRRDHVEEGCAKGWGHQDRGACVSYQAQPPPLHGRGQLEPPDVSDRWCPLNRQ